MSDPRLIGIPKQLKDVIVDTARRRRALIALAPSYRIAERVVSEMQGVDGDMHLGIDGDSYFGPRVDIWMTAKNMGDVAAVLRRLRALTGEKWTERNDYGSGGMNMVAWKSGRIVLNASFAVDSDDPKACRMEKVGVEERPIYKLVCPDAGVDP